MILVPFGSILYSLKALSAYNEDLVDGSIYPSTNANGHSIYEQCETPCTTEEDLHLYLTKQEKSIYPGIFKTFPKECQQFFHDFNDPTHELRSQFYKGWLEPQSHRIASETDPGSLRQPLTTRIQKAT